MIKRREFLKTAGMASLATVSFPAFTSGERKKSHILSLSFDDGFRKSFLKTAEIYEKYRLSGCFNVIASASMPSFRPPDDYIRKDSLGDFDLWNDFVARGHEVMPHGYRHANLTEMPLSEAKELINKCLDIFSENLNGFEPENAIFNFPFNASNAEVENYLSQKVLAYRTIGKAINPLPHKNQKKLTCISYGPENIDSYLQEQIDLFLKQPSGWFIFNSHGLDGEGWGPLSSSLLDELLDRLSAMPHVAVLPVGRALIEL